MEGKSPRLDDCEWPQPAGRHILSEAHLLPLPAALPAPAPPAAPPAAAPAAGHVAEGCAVLASVVCDRRRRRPLDRSPLRLVEGAGEVVYESRGEPNLRE